jgi:hypothetical protein
MFSGPSAVLKAKSSRRSLAACCALMPLFVPVEKKSLKTSMPEALDHGRAL